MKRLAQKLVRGLRYKTGELRYRGKPMKIVFSEIYYNNDFGGQASFSGPGSDLTQTAVIRKEIPILLKEINAKSLLDAACGDFHWLKELDLNLGKYIGIDIVPELISQNQRKYGNEVRQFVNLDITSDKLPQMDIIFCRDCLVHMAFRDIVSAIKNFKESKSEYFLTTTFTKLQNNKNIVTGHWRPINLQLPPFNFPTPLRLINEGCTEENGKYSDKSLGLWKFEDIIIKAEI